MFFDYREVKEYNEIDFDKVKYETRERTFGEWKRIKRPVYSRFWRLVHNLIAHPMLAICRPIGEWLHGWTEEKMYKVIEGKKPINITDKD